MNPLYNDEQKADIEARSAKALEMLKELQLYPQAQVTKGRIVTTEGIEMFADRIQPYLMDTKYVAEGDIYIEKTEITGKPTE